MSVCLRKMVAKVFQEESLRLFDRAAQLQVIANDKRKLTFSSDGISKIYNDASYYKIMSKLISNNDYAGAAVVINLMSDIKNNTGYEEVAHNFYKSKSFFENFRNEIQNHWQEPVSPA